MTRRLLVHLPCRYMAFFYSPEGERWGYSQAARGVFALFFPAFILGAGIGLVVGLLAGVSGRDGAGRGALAALAVAVAFVVYAHVLVYVLAFRGRDWRAR